MSDFLAQKRQEIQDRLNELKPLVEEADRLQAALSALDGASGIPAGKPARRKAPRSARKRTTGTGKPVRRKAAGSARKRTAKAGTGKPGRPKGTGKRQAETLALVIKQPGISISEIAAQTGVQQSYLYRVMPSLQKEGLVRKEGRGWYAN